MQLFFAYCEYDKISDIRHLSYNNHRVIGELLDDNHIK